MKSIDSVAISDLDGEGEELAAALGGRLEEGQAEDLLVQVQRHVAAQLLWVVGQNLELERIDFCMFLIFVLGLTDQMLPGLMRCD